MTHEELWLGQQAFVLPKTGALAAYDVEALKEVAREAGMRGRFAAALLVEIEKMRVEARGTP